MAEPLRHVVVGAGALGLAVAAHAVARGHEVTVATRQGRGAPEGARAVSCNVADPASAIDACRGANVVTFTAAPPYAEWATHYPAMQAGIVEGAAAAGARLVTAENVYVYGRTDAPLTEDTPWQPTSKKGELRARLNQTLLDAHRAGKVQVALGRGPDYYGPRATTNTMYGDQVFTPAVRGRAANVFGDLDAVHTWIYVDDFAAGLVALGEHEAAMGQVWHLPCPPALTQRALLTEIYTQLGQPMRARAMPSLVLKGLAWFMPIMRELAEMEYQWQMRYDFRHDRFDRAFPGAVRVTEHKQAIEATLAWFRVHAP
jgi:nucleoside-diphosphate-sugar epimerase